MCARVLLPAADLDDRGLHARLDRLERRIGVTSSSSPSGPARPRSPDRAAGSGVTPPLTVPEGAVPLPPSAPGRISSAAAATPAPVTPAVPAQGTESAPQKPRWALRHRRTPTVAQVLEEVKGKRRFTWILLSQNARVAELRNGTLLGDCPIAGARDSFARGGNEDVLREAIVVVMGADFTVETMVDPSATSSAGASRTPQAAQPPAVGQQLTLLRPEPRTAPRTPWLTTRMRSRAATTATWPRTRSRIPSYWRAIWARRSSPRRNTAHRLGGQYPIPKGPR